VVLPLRANGAARSTLGHDAVAPLKELLDIRLKKELTTTDSEDRERTRRD